MTERRVTFDYDPEPDLSWLEQWNTPAKYRGNEVVENGQRLSFKEYIRTFGNPDRHVTLFAICEERCQQCGQWHAVDSLHNIDFLDTDNYQTGTFTKDDLAQLGGYQWRLVEEMLRSTKTKED